MTIPDLPSLLRKALPYLLSTKRKLKGKPLKSSNNDILRSVCVTEGMDIPPYHTQEQVSPYRASSCEILVSYIIHLIN